MALARIMLEQGRYADAERYASQVQGQKQLEGLALRAQILDAQGKVKEAIALLNPQKGASGRGGQRVRLVLGELLIESGRRGDAQPVLERFADEWNDDTIKDTDAEGAAMVGRAMHLLRLAKDANEAFKKSLFADKENVELLLWHAALYLEKYDTGHAEESLRDALKLNPKRADALVMMARVKLEQNYDFDEADKLTKKALESNPKHVGAHAIRAGLALRDLDIAAADAELQLGFATDPNDLELWAMKGAVRFLADDRAGYDAAKREALSRNPGYSQFFGTVADFAEWEHRYDDIIGMMKEAVTVDPERRQGLGRARPHRRRAPATRPAASRPSRKRGRGTTSTSASSTRSTSSTAAGSRTATSRRHRQRLQHPLPEGREEAILERYVPQYARARPDGSMKMRYDFAPQRRCRSSSTAIASTSACARAGCPTSASKGCASDTSLAAMSPKSEPFNWGNVLWHELGHVFAIQLSKNHVPRWFTEGLSEYETIVRRPEWRREHDPELYDALSRNILPGAVEMNKAFTHVGGDRRLRSPTTRRAR